MPAQVGKGLASEAALQDQSQRSRIGQRVSFAGRRGITEKGTVKKIKIKYVLVETDRGQRWNVPGSHLTQIKEAVNA